MCFLISTFSYLFIQHIFLRFYHLYHRIWAAVECQLHASGILIMLVKFRLCTSSSYAHLFMSTLFPPHHKWRSRDMDCLGHKLTWPRSQNLKRLKSQLWIQTHPCDCKHSIFVISHYQITHYVLSHCSTMNGLTQHVSSCDLLVLLFLRLVLP